MHIPKRDLPVRRAGHGRHGLAAWVTPATAPGPDLTPPIAVHGIGRGARDQAAAFAARASALGRPVIAPEFGVVRWPLSQQAVRKGRAGRVLLALIEAVRRAAICRTARVDLFGYSGGTQFVHRFAMLHPHLVRWLIPTRLCLPPPHAPA